MHKIPVQMLGDLVSPRALERILLDAAQSRGVEIDDLDATALSEILKKDVFKRLQLSVPAPLAKKRVTEVLNELNKAPAKKPEVKDKVNHLPALEEGAKKFSLYFDWPEAQRLRGVLSIARKEDELGKDIGAFVREAQDLIGQMERRLQEGLVAQGQDLAELKDAFARVQGMGNRDVKRLDNLIEQIDQAHKDQILLPAEVERARALSFKLRKSLESSVVKTLDPSQTSEVEAEVQARVQALEQEHVARRFTDLGREFASLFRARPELELNREELRQQQAAGQLSAEALDRWKVQLETIKAQTIEKQRTELALLEQELATISVGHAARESQVALDVARSALADGNLATEELHELRSIVNTQNYSPEQASRILEQQRDLAELERTAREVPGAYDELQPHLRGAREELARGHDLDISPLWAILERHMGQAAQQREDFDTRADRVIHEYDQVRSLAGETTQRLGRLADTLRAQRRLGALSADARERYAQTLSDAEALLAEAHAEFKAAQEVTSTFGEDALSGLLDVFDFGGAAPTAAESPPLAAAPSEPSALLTPPPAAKSEPSSLLASLRSVSPLNLSPEERVASAFDQMMGEAKPTGPALISGISAIDQADRWLVTYGKIFQGPTDLRAQQLAGLISQAEQAGLTRLDMADTRHAWAARQEKPGHWRLGRAGSPEELLAQLGEWLEHGSN